MFVSANVKAASSVDCRATSRTRSAVHGSAGAGVYVLSAVGAFSLLLRRSLNVFTRPEVTDKL